MRMFNVAEVASAKCVTKRAVYLAAQRGLLTPLPTVNGHRVMAFSEKQVQRYLSVRPGRPKLKKRGGGQRLSCGAGEADYCPVPYLSWGGGGNFAASLPATK